MNSQSFIELQEKEECLKHAVEITKAYAQSGENKHGNLMDFLEHVYEKLVQIKQSMHFESTKK